MTPIHFAHANGIPGAAYRVLFQHLAPYQIHYSHALGLHMPLESRSWQPLAEELAAEIETRHSTPVIGIGHSLGAVLMFRVAASRPELFRQLILLDPPMFGPGRRTMMMLVRMLGLSGRLIAIAKQAAQRRDYFDTREEAFAYWQSRSFFQRFDPASFREYVEEGLVKRPEGGYTLLIPRALEARIFQLTPVWIGRRLPAVPWRYVYAASPGLLTPQEIRSHLARFPQGTMLPFDGGHMFPLEQPEACGQLIIRLIEELENEKSRHSR
jgi:pimeloyl-ACP methyl ester carboxylesterase